MEDPDEEALRHAAIMKIQAVHRGRMGRRKAQRVKKEHDRRARAKAYHDSRLEAARQAKIMRQRRARERRKACLRKILEIRSDCRDAKQCRRLLRWVSKCEMLPVDCSESTGIDVCRVLTYKEVSAGKTLFEQGRTAWECYIIIDGIANVFVNDQKVATMGRNQFFGAASLKRDGGLRGATVAAETDLALAALSRENYIALIALNEHYTVIQRAELMLELFPLLNRAPLRDPETGKRVDKWNDRRTQRLVKRMVFQELEPGRGSARYVLKFPLFLCARFTSRLVLPFVNYLFNCRCHSY
jgi:hypothetical protein